jgi:hypothetical protein
MSIYRNHEKTFTILDSYKEELLQKSLFYINNTIRK